MEPISRGKENIDGLDLEKFLKCEECECPYCLSNKQVWHPYEGYHICLGCKERYF